MRRLLIAVLLLVPVSLAAQSRARNVILFLADAGGISTIAATSLHVHGAPRGLFVQRMPYIGLSETSTASQLVTDSAAGMTAIVTGQRTHNGVLGQSATAARGKADGEPLQTILEYAEARGLSTGIVTDDSPAGATPAALYAKANDRSTTAFIFKQAFAPRYGDGVDVMIGARREALVKAFQAEGIELEAFAREKGRPIVSTVSEIPASATRAIVLHEAGTFDKGEAVHAAIRMLSRNRKGYFLMVEADTHADPIRRGLDRLAELESGHRADGADGRTRHAAAVHRRPLVRHPDSRRPPRQAAARRSRSRRSCRAQGADSHSRAPHGERPFGRRGAGRSAGPRRATRPRLHGQHRSFPRHDGGLRLARAGVGAVGVIQHTRLDLEFAWVEPIVSDRWTRRVRARAAHRPSATDRPRTIARWWAQSASSGRCRGRRPSARRARP